MTDRATRHVPTLRESLGRDHQRLDTLFVELEEAARAGVDPRRLGEIWTRFERGLLHHLDVEERVLFPELEAAHPDVVKALRAQHAHLRGVLRELDIRVDLHALREPAVRTLLDTLRAHAAREDATLYTWADEELSWYARRRLASRLLVEADRSTAGTLPAPG